MAPVRLILNEKRLSKALWAELIKGVAYVKNRCPGVDGTTPFQKINDFKSDVSNLRVLECRAWIHVSKITARHKLDSRSWQGIMIDYEGINQWRIYNPVNRKIHVSRDVRFDELSSYDESIGLNDNEEAQDECWNEENDSLFDDITQNKNAEGGVLLGSPSEESRYPTPVSEDLPDNSALVGALEDLEEEKEDEVNLLHTSEPPEHVISQGVMMPPIQPPIHASIT